MDVAESLRPYVPRLVVDWLYDTPAARHKAVDGTLAFVDISGFTKMTERLARKGKVGAEEMSDTLNRTFAQLLSVAYEYGAGLVKWGGDAVLLLFEGDGHAPRACRAAAGMQRAIRTVGRLQTTAGPVRLRMSVGIHSGTFDFFLVGDIHRELLVSGPAASHTVTMEQTAEAGEIAVSPATAALLEPAALGKPKGDSILLRREPAAEELPAEPVRDVSRIPLADCLPVAIRDHLLLERGEAEHRTVTVAFVEFSGIDRLLADEGVEAAADALEECMSVAQHATQRHQVTFFETDINRDGGKIMLVAGAPTTAGNDQDRMLRTLRFIADAGCRLSLRMGVNSGRVFSGDFGPPFRRTYSIKGDAINLAARVMGKAGAGQVLATDAVLAGSRAKFEAAPLEPFMVKGKAQPVRASIVGPLQRGLAAGGGGTPLIGREDELAALVLALDSAREWEGRLFEIVAEPGVGKSRLLDELRSRAGDLLVVGTECEEYEAATPYYPFRSLLRGLLDVGDWADGAAAADQVCRAVNEVAPHLAPWAPLIGAVLDVDIPPTPETESLDERFLKPRLEETVRELLGILLSTPTLLVLEDVHWLDDASTDLLAALVEGIGFRPWLVVVTRRQTGAGFRAVAGERVVTLELEPLGPESAAALVEAATDELPLAPHDVEALVRRAGGNPLYLEQLVAAARAAGGIDSLPDSLESLLASRIDRVAPRDRMVLRYASVVGVAFDESLLAAALEGDAEPPDRGVWERLADVVARDSDETLRFRHGLLRDAAYEGLPYKRRQAVHGRVGATIERLAGDPEEQAELLSLHFFHAHRADEAWRYSRIAGDRAQAIHAYSEAALYHERALDAARRLPSIEREEVGAVTAALGDVRFHLGELDRAAAAFRAARRVGALPIQAARLMFQEASIPIRQGRYTQALRWIRRALRLLEGLDDQEARAQRAELFAWHAVVRLRQGRPQEAANWCRRAIEEASAADAQGALARAYYVLDYALFALGRGDEAVYSPRALAIYEELGNLIDQGGVLNNQGLFAYFAGRWDEAAELYGRAERAWEKGGDRWAASFATVNRGEILADQGRLDEAEPLFRGGLRVARASGTRARIAEVARYYGRLTAHGGRFEEAHALLQEAREIYEHDGPRAELATTDARLAECLLLEGRAEAAQSLADETLARVEREPALSVFVATLLRVRGSAHMLAGELVRARQDLERSAAEARARGADYDVALTLDALAELHEREGEPAPELARERDAIVARLGVVATPRLPFVSEPAAALG